MRGASRWEKASHERLNSASHYFVSRNSQFSRLNVWPPFSIESNLDACVFICCSRIEFPLFPDFQFPTWARFRHVSAHIDVFSIQELTRFADFRFFAYFSFPEFRSFSFPDFSRSSNWEFPKLFTLITLQCLKNFGKREAASESRKVGEPGNWEASKKCACVTGPASFCSLCRLSLSRSRVPFLLRRPFLCRAALLCGPSLCHPLLSSFCCRYEEIRDAPLAPLALNKENFAVVASRSMTKT
jgi:hypothetical protein